MVDQQVSPPPGLLRRISDARYRLYRKLSQARTNEEVIEGGLSIQETEATYEVKKGWLPPLFMYSNWTERLKSIMTVESVEDLVEDEDGENIETNNDSKEGTEGGNKACQTTD